MEVWVRCGPRADEATLHAQGTTTHRGLRRGGTAASPCPLLPASQESRQMASGFGNKTPLGRCYPIYMVRARPRAAAARHGRTFRRVACAVRHSMRATLIKLCAFPLSLAPRRNSRSASPTARARAAPSFPTITWSACTTKRRCVCLSQLCCGNTPRLKKSLRMLRPRYTFLPDARTRSLAHAHSTPARACLAHTVSFFFFRDLPAC